MTVSNSHSQNTPTDSRPWLDECGLEALNPGRDVLDWLTFDGLLTPRLRLHSAVPVSLAVLREEPIARHGNDTDLLREVALSAGGERLVYALSWFPAQVISRNPWLKTLAQKPLGDALCSLPNVSRSNFEFQHILAGEPRYERAVEASDERPSGLWARRSRFNLEGGSVLVEEVFLPGVFAGTTCPG